MFPPYCTSSSAWGGYTYFCISAATERERHLLTGQFLQTLVFTEVFCISAAVTTALTNRFWVWNLSSPSPSVSAVPGCKQVNSGACWAARWVAAWRCLWADADHFYWPRLSPCWPCSQNSASRWHGNYGKEGFWKNLWRLEYPLCFCISCVLFSSLLWTRKESALMLSLQIWRRSRLKILFF